MDILKSSQLVIFSHSTIFITFSYRSLAGFLFKLLRSSRRWKPEVALDFCVWPLCVLWYIIVFCNWNPYLGADIDLCHFSDIFAGRDFRWKECNSGSTNLTALLMTRVVDFTASASKFASFAVKSVSREWCTITSVSGNDRFQDGTFLQHSLER